jgi:divalent metal cation (Fe/Co/Zn/Cd) transporter
LLCIVVGVSANDLLSELIRKVVSPVEGEEIYIYLVLALISGVAYLIYDLYQSAVEKRTHIDQMTFGEVAGS